MQQIFTNEPAEAEVFTITGQDAHHLKRVVRLKNGEKIRVTYKETSFLCEITDSPEDVVCAKILEEMSCSELSNKIYIFQAIPKGDRMETIIEKCVELGVYEIIPVEMKNCIVKLDDKKKASRINRYNSIAKSAAEQSKRSIIPRVTEFMSFAEACAYARELDLKLFPYESKNGMADTYRILDGIKEGQSIGVFVGPEGGFDKKEVDKALEEGMEIISLGKRILRTDTAAICSASMLMLKCEEFIQ